MNLGNTDIKSEIQKTVTCLKDSELRTCQRQFHFAHSLQYQKEISYDHAPASCMIQFRTTLLLLISADIKLPSNNY